MSLYGDHMPPGVTFAHRRAVPYVHHAAASHPVRSGHISGIGTGLGHKLLRGGRHEIRQESAMGIMAEEEDGR